jgi:hypothetical protein
VTSPGGRVELSDFLQSFRCLGDRCEDTCCQGWGMQVDDATYKLYQEQAPDLLNSVTAGEADHVMRRDPDTDYCVQFNHGWCRVHADRGTAFLGDACHFFPRVTRQLGTHTLMTAALSCPEVTRLVLAEEQTQPFATQQQDFDRLPYTLKNYLPEGMDAAAAWQLHQTFLQEIDNSAITAEHHLSRLFSISQSLDALDKQSWPVAVPFYFSHVESRLQKPEALVQDPFHLVNALIGLMGAARQSPRIRLMAIVQSLEQALALTVNWDSLTISLSPSSLSRWQEMQTRWQQVQAEQQPSLRRWLQAQLSIALFPFAGLGNALTERMGIIAVRFATVKLALMAHYYLTELLTRDDKVRIIQSLSRFLDHLADPEFSLAIYNEMGWLRAPRLRALIGDA